MRPPGYSDHVLAGFQGEHVETHAKQDLGQPAGAAADLENRPPARDLHDLKDVQDVVDMNVE